MVPPMIEAILVAILILALLVLGAWSWRKQFGQADDPDKQAQRPIWRPGDGSE